MVSFSSAYIDTTESENATKNYIKNFYLKIPLYYHFFDNKAVFMILIRVILFCAEGDSHFYSYFLTIISINDSSVYFVCPCVSITVSTVGS